MEMEGRAETRSWIQWAVVRSFMASGEMVGEEEGEEEEEERAIIEQVRKRMSSRMSAAALLIPSVSKTSAKRMLD